MRSQEEEEEEEEIDASLMKKRIIDGRIQYYRKLTTGNNDLLKTILEQTKERT